MAKYLHRCSTRARDVVLINLKQIWFVDKIEINCEGFFSLGIPHRSLATITFDNTVSDFSVNHYMP